MKLINKEEYIACVFVHPILMLIKCYKFLRGIVSGGVYTEEDDAAPDRILNIFGYDEFNIISATIKETANLLPVLKDGNYIFVCHE